MRDGVNTFTGVVLGSVWLVVQTTPSAISADSATRVPCDDDQLSAARDSQEFKPTAGDVSGRVDGDR
jgi:hypothetical protein